MSIIFALALLLAGRQSRPKNDEPLISATKPDYLGCSVWTSKGWSDPTSRSVRTPVLRSSMGFRAFAEVKAVFKDGLCKNTTILYVASAPGNQYIVVYQKSPGETSGNGIRLIGWSPRGDKLLAQVSLWDHDSDSGYGHLALVFVTSTNSAREARSLNDALGLLFGPDCEFELEITGWKTSQQILVKVSRTPMTSEHEQHFCVKKPRKFVYDLQKETVEATHTTLPDVR
jgi:hypothetical protein